MSKEKEQGSVLEGINKTQDLYIDSKNNNFEFINSLYREGNLHFTTNNGIWQNFRNVSGNVSEYVTNHTKQATEAQFEHFRSMIKTIQEVYPDRWNLDYYYDRTLKKVVFLGFAVHFSQMWINNNTGAKHLMRDIYSFSPVSVNLNKPNFLSITTLHTTRMTTSVREHLNSYFHSHQTGQDVSRYPKWEHVEAMHQIYSSMCLGDHTQGVSRANTEFARDPNTDNFISCLLHIRSTLGYESLEGGPHRTFSGIESGSNNRSSSRFSRSIGANTVEKMGQFLLKFALKEDPNLLLKFDLKYHPFLSKSLIFQDSLKLKEILDKSFRKLVEVTPDPNSKIVLERTSTGVAQSYSLSELSKLFQYKSTQGSKFIDCDRFYLEENQTQTGDRVTKVYNYPMMFRGQLVPAQVVEPGNQVPGESYGKLYPGDSNIELDESYFRTIKNSLTQKLIKNVFLQEKEISKA